MVYAERAKRKFSERIAESSGDASADAAQVRSLWG
jgi:hypothetical protein